jgi:hypothetical protein
MKYDISMKLANSRLAELEFSQTRLFLEDAHLAKLSELARLLHL